MNWLLRVAEQVCALLPCAPRPGVREQAWQAWAAEYDRAPGSQRERELWLAYNLTTVERRQAA